MEIFSGKSKIKQQHWLDRLNQCPVSWTGISTCDVTATSSIWTPILCQGARQPPIQSIHCRRFKLLHLNFSPPCLRGCLQAPIWSASLTQEDSGKKVHISDQLSHQHNCSTTVLSSQLVRTVLLVGRPVSSCQQVVSSSCNSMIRSSFLAVLLFFHGFVNDTGLGNWHSFWVTAETSQRDWNVDKPLLHLHGAAAHHPCHPSNTPIHSSTQDCIDCKKSKP